MFTTSLACQDSKENCALEIRDNGIAYAHICYPERDNSRPILKHCGFFNGEDSLEQLAESLNLIANKYNAKNVKCNWVLAQKYYRLLLVNTPNVPTSEHKDALRWQLKDMIDHPANDMTIDTFAPSSFSQIDHPKLYTVVAQSSVLQKLVTLIKQATFTLQAIDIQEFAIRNLLAALPSTSQSTGFLHINSVECLLTIVKNGELHFVRRIPITTDIMQSIDERTFDRIGDEISKSLDYYTAELKQEMPKEFLLSPTIEKNSPFVSNIKNRVPLQFSNLLLNKAVRIENSADFSEDLLKKCYIAIGGALRQSEEQ